ncbi:MAG: hypothetical protein ACI88A_005260, partial [Paraglaciecola sp.]
SINALPIKPLAPVIKMLIFDCFIIYLLSY